MTRKNRSAVNGLFSGKSKTIFENISGINNLTTALQTYQEDVEKYVAHITGTFCINNEGYQKVIKGYKKVIKKLSEVIKNK